MFYSTCCFILISGLAVSQTTQLDLKSQSKSVDFTGASYTRPVKTGTVLPALCQVADLFFQTVAAPGANLFGCVAANTWSVLSGGSGSGSGSGSSSSLAMFSTSRSTSSALRVGETCSITAPCNVRLGNTVYSIQTTANVSLNSGSGIAFIYIAADGTLTVGHTMNISCTGGCSAQPGITAFPNDSIPLYTWSATSGAWDLSGGVDLRSFLSSKPVTAGLGMVSAGSSGVTTLSVDSTVVALRVSVPGSSATSCSLGNWAADPSFFYFCVGANVWRRVGGASW